MWKHRKRHVNNFKQCACLYFNVCHRCFFLLFFVLREINRTTPFKMDRLPELLLSDMDSSRCSFHSEGCFAFNCNYSA